MYELDDITLIPRVISTIKSRDEIKPSVDLFPGVELSVPIIAAPMMDVCNGAFALKMRQLGGFGFIHRFQPIGNQVKEFYESEKQGGSAIGLNDHERLDALYRAGCRHFCLDVANGASKMVSSQLKEYQDSFGTTYWIVGNVASMQTYKWWCDKDVWATRCSIGSGKGCSTSEATGIYYPMGSLLEEINNYHKYYRDRAKLGGYKVQGKSYLPRVIADGGINTPGKFCKALALGADFVMMGATLAIAKESPAKKINSMSGMGIFSCLPKTEFEDRAIYRGSASFEIQSEYREPRYIEGKEVLLDYKGESLETIINCYMDGLRSSMSYMNARTLQEYRDNVSIGYLK